MALNVYPKDLCGVNFEGTTTSAKFALGEKCFDSKGGSWVYVQANGAIAINDAVKVDKDFQASKLTTAVSGAEPTDVGIAQVAFANDEYGWVFEGPGGGDGSGIKVNALTLCATDVKLYTTATDGAVDDTATDLIQGLMLCSTNATGGTVATECYATQKLVTNCQD